MSKNYDWLRPFSGKVLIGETLLWRRSDLKCRMLGESKNSPNCMGRGQQYCIEHDGGLAYTYADDLFVPPLCWVEGRPVYKGDTLYHRHGDEFTELVVDRLGSYSTPSVLQEGSGIGWHIECLTWKAPKVKREAWIAVKTGEKPQSYASWCSHVCKTKEQAEAYYGDQPVCCVRIEWEEEA